MKNVDTGLIRTARLALIAALVIALAFVGPVSAEPLGPDIPTFPNFFYGTVRTDQGIVLPGQQVVALAVTGGWTGNSTAFTDPASRYGYTPQFFVPGVESGVPGTGAVNGDQIAFFVQGVQALLYNVATGATSPTYSFVSGGDTELNLIVPLRYTITATAGPNGAISPQGEVSVNHSFNQTFTFTPNANYQILDVLVDGVSNPGAVAAGSYTFTNVTANHTIHATFVRSTYVITPTAGPGCTITPGTPQIVPYKGSKVFNIAATSGYDLLDVFVDGASQGPIPSYVFTNITDDHTIAATCKLKGFVITPVWGSGGSIVPGTPQTVSYGGSVTFNIVPNSGYAVDNVIVNGISQGAITTYTFTNVTANGTIAAAFAPARFVITPTAGVGGTISPSTPQTVNYGGSATFTIAANAGYNIVEVLVDGVPQGAITNYTFTNVTANHTITAIFTTDNFVITPTAGAGGTIAPSTPQLMSYGGSATFTFTPGTGYLIDTVLVDGVPNPGAVAAGSYTFTNVMTNHSIAVTFKPATFVITPTAGAHGTITPGTPQAVNYGANATFTITPDTGYLIDDVRVDGVSNPVAVIAGSYTFTNVTANHVIEATFRVKTFVITPTAGAHGTITPGTPQTVNYGGSITFTIVPDPGYAVDIVIANGVSLGPVKSHTFTNVTADGSIVALFKKGYFLFLPLVLK